MGGYSTISIPKPLKESLEDLIKGTGFQNVSEFTKFVLRDIASQGSFEGPEEYTESMEQVHERLRNLGYLGDGSPRSQQRPEADASIEE